MTSTKSSSKPPIVGVDTNILINFGNFKRLAWKALFPDATSVTVLVAAKVQSEMDHHKDHGAGYVRKRAKEFQTIVRAAEDSGYEVSIDDNDIPVRCVFLDRPKSGLLNSEQFDLTDADELIVAQYQHAAGAWGEVTVVANDASTIRAARRAGMSTLRPDRWTADRSEPEDDNTRALRERNKELERVVGARPKLELTNLTVDGCGHGNVRFADDFDYEAFQDDIRQRLSTRIALPSRSDLIRNFGRRQSGFEYSIRPLWGGIGDSELDAWDDKVRSFVTFFDSVSESEMLKRLARLGLVHILDVILSNMGDAPERNLCVDLEVRGDARFFRSRVLAEVNDWNLSKPEPPTLTAPTLEAMRSAFAPPPVEDEHSFYVRSRSDTEEKYRRAIMLQRQSTTIRSYLIAKNVTPPPTVLVSVGAQHMLDPVVREVALAPVSRTLDLQAIETLVLDRLGIMPEKQADVLRAAFGEL